MKTIVFQEKQYTVPDWAKYITQDEDGAIKVFELKPVLDYADNLDQYWCDNYNNLGSRSAEVSRPEVVCEEIK